MSLTDRIILAAAIVIIDTAAFAIPLSGFVLAWVILARPPWFRDWTQRLYADGGSSPPTAD